MPSASSASPARETLPFNSGWRFHRHDPEPAASDLSRDALRPWLLPQTNEFSNYSPAPHTRPPGAEPGSTLAVVRPAYDDSAWRALSLPHDWAIEGPFDQSLPGETGKLPWIGAGWYRKTFTLPASDAGRHLSLEIDGAMSHSAVWLNGRFVGGWPYGYTSFRLDLTPYAKPGADNVLAIRLENPPESSRWYPGAGLYRSVRLVKTNAVRLAPWSTFVTTPVVSAERALVDVRLEVENHEPTPAAVELRVALHALDDSGAPAAEPAAIAEPQTFEVKPGRPRLTSFPIEIVSPRIWDIDTPCRYVAVATLSRAGQPLDRTETPFGVRSLSVDPDRGLVLNGRVIKLNGVCQHHDLGALGAAVHVPALERQLRILRDMGVNSIRTSHNPPAPELLDLCDRLGLLVQAEAFDAWAVPKKENDYSVHFPWWHEADLRALVRRDRNHPCVAMWSIGNEILEQGENDGWRVAARLAGIVREEDRTRPVAAGYNWVASGYNGFDTPLDIFGYNYKPHEYPVVRARHPRLALLGSETSSTISSRGEYFFPVSGNKDHGRSDFQMSSYDLYAPEWATTPDAEFAAQDEHAYLFGEYVWTGFDYLGEPTPYNDDATNLLNHADPEARARAAAELAALGKIKVPSRSSYFGIVDLAGFPKDRYFLYQARWRPELPVAHLLPHWTWPGREGEITPVHLYTSGDEAELFLNGQSLGRKKRGPRDYRLRWDDVVYQPGELRAVAYKNGQPWAESIRRTAGSAAALRLVPEPGYGGDLAFIQLRVEDAADNLVPRAKLLVRFSVSGPATILATDNGDATDHTPFPSSSRTTFNGLALVILRVDSTAPFTLVAESDGLPSARVTIPLR